MRIGFLMVAMSLLIFVSCKSAREKQAEAIAKIENEFKADTTGRINFTVATQLIKQYEAYAAANPADTLSAVYLFRAADVATHTHNVKYAVELYKRFIKEYPQDRNVPQAWFYIGFLYDNELKDYVEARKAYEMLLQKFPQYEQRATVEWLLSNLGKSDIELARQLETGKSINADSGNVVVQ